MKAGTAKPTQWNKRFLLVITSLFLGSGLLRPSRATAVESPLRTGATVGSDEVRGLLVLRVSEAFIRSELEREVYRCAPVDRTIEGTRSRGTAVTTAQVTVKLRPQNEGIAFDMVGQGIVNMNTVGRNGPVILHSNLQTPFSARVPIQFDGTHFKRKDLALQTNSRLRILSVQSDQPGLRGRLVTKVARRRAAERLARAQAISGLRTEQALRRSINESVDKSIQKLNERLQTRRLLSLLLRTTKGRWLRYSSSTDALCVAWYPLMNSEDIPRCPLQLGGNAAVQLWIHDQWATALGIDELPKITEDFESWARVVFPNISVMENVPLPSALPLPPIQMERVEDWLVVKIEPATP